MGGYGEPHHHSRTGDSSSRGLLIEQQALPDRARRRTSDCDPNIQALSTYDWHRVSQSDKNTTEFGNTCDMVRTERLEPSWTVPEAVVDLFLSASLCEPTESLRREAVVAWLSDQHLRP